MQDSVFVRSVLRIAGKQLGGKGGVGFNLHMTFFIMKKKS